MKSKKFIEKIITNPEKLKDILNKKIIMPQLKNPDTSVRFFLF